MGKYVIRNVKFGSFKSYEVYLVYKDSAQFISSASTKQEAKEIIVQHKINNQC